MKALTTILLGLLMSMGAWAEIDAKKAKELGLIKVFLECGEKPYDKRIFDLYIGRYKSCSKPHYEYQKAKENAKELMCGGNIFEESGNNVQLLIGSPDYYILLATINREDLTIGYLQDEPNIQCKLITKDDYLRTKDSWLLSIDEYRKKEEAKRKF
jgi:hypothetical protein|tara:strand:+ start:784 stop:1251 length:468 start_codon:yes stop_codon:yes gene_type:complete